MLGSLQLVAGLLPLARVHRRCCILDHLPLLPCYLETCLRDAPLKTLGAYLESVAGIKLITPLLPIVQLNCIPELPASASLR